MKNIFLGSALLLLTACVNGNCRSHQSPNADPKALSPASVSTGTQPHVKVFKPDGSQQCAMGKAVSVGDMQKDLAEIPIFSSQNKADGLMHIQACGTPTGKVNIYEIEKPNLEAAKKKGFREWTGE